MRVPSLTSRRSPSALQGGFTLLELLTVIGIVIVLAALILNGMGYAQNKSAASRATGEIAALSNLLEAFKADFGSYPKPLGEAVIAPTDSATAPDSLSSQLLAVHLFGDLAITGPGEPPKDPGEDAEDKDKEKYKEDKEAYDAAVESHEAGKAYLNSLRRWAKKNHWLDSGLALPSPRSSVQVNAEGNRVFSKYLVDPFGNPYGYSTSGKRNPTFDLWSTGGVTPARGENLDDVEPRWIKNW